MGRGKNIGKSQSPQCSLFQKCILAATRHYICICIIHFFPFGTIREISALEWFLRFLKYLIITSNFAFCNCSYLGFHFLKEDRATLELLSILNSTIIIPKLHIKVAVRAIFKKIYNLRNLTFNNFMTNLGFLPLQEDLEILQQFIVPWYH